MSISFEPVNLADAPLASIIDSTDLTITLEAGYGSRFASVFPYPVVIEEKNTSGVVLKREIANCTGRTDDELVITRAYEACPSSDTDPNQSQVALTFNNPENTTVSAVFTAGNAKSLRDGVLKKIDASIMINSGVISGLAITTGSISAGSAILVASSGLSYVYNGSTESITTTGTLKYWLAVENGDLVRKSGASYPGSDYIPLASITGGVITDERTYATGKYDSAGNALTEATMLSTDEIIKRTASGLFKRTPYSALLTDMLAGNSLRAICGDINITADDVCTYATLPDFRIITPEKASGGGGAYKRTTERFLGNTSANTRRSVAIIGNGVSASTIKLALRKVGTPADNFTVRIETDNGSSQPSGTLAHANATGSTAGSGLLNTTAGLTETTINFAGAFTLADNTLYHIVLSRSGGVDGANYFVVGYINLLNRSYRNNAHNGTSWGTWNGVPADGSTDAIISCTYAGCYSKVMQKARADLLSGCYFNGIANATYTIGTIGIFTPPGFLFSGFSGLAKSTPYYLSNTPGLISTTPGTIPVLVGFSDNTGNNLLINDPSPLEGYLSEKIWDLSGASSVDLMFEVQYPCTLASTSSGGTGVTVQYVTKNGVSFLGSSTICVPGDIIQIAVVSSSAPVMTLSEIRPIPKLFKR